MQEINLETTTSSSSQQPASFRRYGLTALALTLLGLILRLLGLGSRPLWFDEIISVIYASQDVPTLIALNSGDNHPVGFYLTLKGWITLFGDSTTVVRLLAVGPGVVAIWLTWLIARRLFPSKPQIGLVAVGLMAGSPFQIYFSQEVRNYSFLEMYVLAAIWFWLRGLEQNDWPDWIGLGLATALGLAFNLTTAFYLVPLGLFMLTGLGRYWRNGRLLRFGLVLAGGGALASVVLLPKLNRLGAIKGNFWVPTPDLLIVLRTFYTFIFGTVPANLFVIAFGLAFVILILVIVQIGIGLVSLVARLRDSSYSRSLSRNSHSNNTNFWLTVWLLWGPLLLIFGVSLVFQPIYLDKALIGCAPFYYILLGWTIFRPGQEKKIAGRLLAFGTPVALAVLLALVSLPQLYTGVINPLYIARYDAPRIDQYLASRYRSGDVIATATDISLLPLIYYQQPKLPTYQIAEYPYPNVFPALLDRVGSAFVPQANFAQQYKRVWLVFEVNSPENLLNAPPRPADLSVKPDWFHSPTEQQATLDWFNARYQRLDAVYLDRVMLVLYELS